MSFKSHKIFTVIIQSAQSAMSVMSTVFWNKSPLLKGRQVGMVFTGEIPDIERGMFAVVNALMFCYR